MTQTKNVTDVLNSTIEALQSVLPFTIIIDSPKLFKSPIAGHTVGVLIGITGDIKGRMIIDAEKEIISKIGEGMFGMPLQEEMFESFAGELGNMLAGNRAVTTMYKPLQKKFKIHLLSYHHQQITFDLLCIFLLPRQT